VRIHGEEEGSQEKEEVGCRVAAEGDHPPYSTGREVIHSVAKKKAAKKKKK
jgi:hypothetical protein